MALRRRVPSFSVEVTTWPQRRRALRSGTDRAGLTAEDRQREDAASVSRDQGIPPPGGDRVVLSRGKKSDAYRPLTQAAYRRLAA